MIELKPMGKLDITEPLLKKETEIELKPEKGNY